MSLHTLLIFADPSYCQARHVHLAPAALHIVDHGETLGLVLPDHEKPMLGDSVVPWLWLCQSRSALRAQQAGPAVSGNARGFLSKALHPPDDAALARQA